MINTAIAVASFMVYRDYVDDMIRKFLGPSGPATPNFLDWAQGSSDLRTVVEVLAGLLGVREAIRELPDLEAVRLLQRREGYTPCYGREVPLRPGPGSVCLETGCCWRNSCSAYRSEAVPLDGYLSSVPSQSDFAQFKDFLLARGQAHPYLAKDEVWRPERRTRGVGVTVRAQAALEPLSRKLVIGSPSSTLCESSDSSNILRPVQLDYGAMGVCDHYMRNPPTRFERTIWWTANPERIFNWYASARKLIDASTIDYLPHVSVDSAWGEGGDRLIPKLQQLRQLDTPHLGAPNGEVLVSDPNFVPLLNLDIPFLESASLDSIYRLMQDYPDELCAFRSFLFKNIDRIKDKRLESETFAADLEAIRREIDDQIRKLRSDLNRSQLKHYVDMAGGIAAAFTLAVFCVVQHDSHTLAVIGPGGFLYVLSTKIAEYLSARLALRDNPAYFLWMIGPSKRL